MSKSIKIVAIILFAVMSCNSVDIKDRMKEYEYQLNNFEEKVNKIENDSLKQKMYGIASMLYGEEMSEIYKQMVPNESSYINDPYFLINSYNSYEDIANNHMNGQILLYSECIGSKYTIRTFDAFKYPDEYPFKIKTIWQTVLFDNQETYPIVLENFNENIKSADHIQVFESGNWRFPKSFDIYYPTDKITPVPIKISAKIQTELPSTIHQFQFLKKDIGKTQTIDNISVKLLSMENAFIELEVTTPDHFITNDDSCGQYEWLNVEAKDKTHQFISMKTASNYKSPNQEILSELYQELTQKEEYNSEFLSDFFVKADSIIEMEKTMNELRDKNKHYRFQVYRGIVDEILVDIFDYRNSKMIEKEIVYPISDHRNLINQGDFKEIKTSATVYDNETTEMFTKGYDLTEDKLEEQILIHQGFNKKDNRANVNFNYPNFVSSKIMMKRFNALKELAFLNKNKKQIPISPDSIGYNHYWEQNLLVDFSGGSLNYFIERFPEIPYYMQGILEVNIAIVEKHEYNAETLPDGIYIKDNVVLKPHWLNRSNYALFVKDSTNRYLKSIVESSGTVNINGIKSDKSIIYYYGKPQIIEIYTIKDTIKTNYKFNVKLTHEEIPESSIWN